MKKAQKINTTKQASTFQQKKHQKLQKNVKIINIVHVCQNSQQNKIDLRNSFKTSFVLPSFDYFLSLSSSIIILTIEWLTLNKKRIQIVY